MVKTCLRAGLLVLAALAMSGLTEPSRVSAVEATSRAGQALIEVASMETVDIALAATAVSQTTERSDPPDAPADLRVAFRIPAAYVARVTDEKRSLGRGWLTLRLWSQSFDPVRPDELADLATCSGEERFQGCPRRGLEGSRYAARRRGGEYVITLEVGHTAGTEAYRRYMMTLEAVVGSESGTGRQPCDTRWDEALGMLVSRTPEGLHPMDACKFGTVGSIHRNGRALMPAAFLKLEQDGTPRFSVKCRNYVTMADEGVPPRGCRMIGHHGPWPLIISVQSDRVMEWDTTFDRLRDFLARHEMQQNN